jgi:hypothetical protein
MEQDRLRHNSRLLRIPRRFPFPIPARQPIVIRHRHPRHLEDPNRPPLVSNRQWITTGLHSNQNSHYRCQHGNLPFHPVLLIRDAMNASIELFKIRRSLRFDLLFREKSTTRNILRLIIRLIWSSDTANILDVSAIVNVIFNGAISFMPAASLY